MQLNPYLIFDGQCEEAFNFYAQLLNGKIEAMMSHEGTPAAEHLPADQQHLILHARMKIGDSVLMASDCPPGYYEQPQGVKISLHPTDPAEAERIFAALAEGGTVQMPIQETFWAIRFGMLTDRFGIQWMVNCEAAS